MISLFILNKWCGFSVGDLTFIFVKYRFKLHPKVSEHLLEGTKIMAKSLFIWDICWLDFICYYVMLFGDFSRHNLLSCVYLLSIAFFFVNEETVYTVHIPFHLEPLKNYLWWKISVFKCPLFVFEGCSHHFHLKNAKI